MAEPLDTVVVIETPEHIVFRHRIAGPARRAIAYGIDLVVCYGGLLLIGILLAIVLVGSLVGGQEGLANVGLGLFLLLLFCAQWVYFVAFEALTGRTPGKKLMGLRVVTAEGRPIGFTHAALRNLLRVADFLPTAYLVGGAFLFLSRRFQRVGDLVAGTLVIAPDKPTVATAAVLWPPPHPAELAAVPQNVVLDAEERAAIELFVRRRGALGPAREHELASMIAPGLALRHGMPLTIDPSRFLAILHDRATHAGRKEAIVRDSLPPPSSREAA